MTRVLKGSIIAVLVILSITASLYYYMRYSGLTSNVLKAVPEDAVMIFQIQKTDSVAGRIIQSEFVNMLSGFDAVANFKNAAAKFKSFYDSNIEFRQILQARELTVSLHNTTTTSYDLLYLINIREIENINFNISKVFKNVENDNTRNYDGVEIHDLGLDSNQTFSYAFTQGLFIASGTPFLVEDAIRQLHTGTPIDKDDAFRQLQKSKLNSGFKIFINQNKINSWLGLYLNQNAATNLNFKVNGWSELNLSMIPNAITFTGKTAIADSSSLLSVFQNQQQRNLQLLQLLPANTAYLKAFSFTDKNSFMQRFTTFNLTDNNFNSMRSQLTSTEQAAGVSLISTLENILGNEFAISITETSGNSTNNNSYAILQLNDFKNSFRYLNLLADKVAAKNKTGSKSETYRGHKINSIDIPEVLPAVLGNNFKDITNFYFTDISNFILVANQSSSLHSFIDEYEKGNRLVKTKSMLQLNSGIPMQSNYLTLIQPSLCYYQLKPLLSDTLSLILEDKRSDYNRIGIIALNYAMNNNSLQTSYFINNTNEIKSSVNVVWNAQVEHPIITTPIIVNGLADGAKYICVQDSAFQMYLIDNSGNIVLKKQLNDKITSTIFAIDYFKNGSKQLLFNTESQIWLCDKSGNDITAFPIKLPSKASCGLSVFDYDNTLDYRIYVPCVNWQVYAYQPSGKPVPNWSFKSTSEINIPVTLFMSNKKEYLIISSASGNLVAVDRTGKQIFTVKEKFILNKESGMNQLSSDSLSFICLAKNGELKKINQNGEVSKIDFPDSSAISNYILDDLNKDAKPDYILLTNNKLLVYDTEFKNLLEVSSDFSHSRIIGTSLTEDNKKLILVFDNATKQVNAWNLRGKNPDGFPVTKITNALINDLNNDKNFKLIAMPDSLSVKVYSIN